MKILLLLFFILTGNIANCQVLKYEIVSYQNCIYDQVKDTLTGCKSSRIEKPALFEIDPDKNAVRQVTGNKIKIFRIKEHFNYFASSEYIVKDETGLTWLYQIQNDEKDDEALNLLVWSCNEKGEPIYFNKKASVGKWKIMAPLL